MSDNISSLNVKQTVTNGRLSRMSLVERAIALSQTLDIPVFPVKDNKAPACTNGVYDGTKDPEKIKELFAAAPNAKYVGGRMGNAADAFVVDVDLYKDPARLHQWSQESGVLDQLTFTVTTRNGGKHYYFLRTFPIGNPKPTEAVEVKGEGGYVILPDGIDYTIDGDGEYPAFAVFPENKRFNLLGSGKEGKDKPADRRDIREKIQKAATGDDFHDNLRDVIASLAAYGPPAAWINAFANGLADTAIETRKRLGDHARADDLQKRRDGGEVERMVIGAIEKYLPEKEEYASALTAENAFQWGDLFDEAKANPTPFIIPGWLPSDTVTTFYGKDGVGKTKVALYILICLAVGREVMGYKSKPKRVFAMLCEDHDKEIATRVFQIVEHLQLDEREKSLLQSNFVCPLGLQIQDVKLCTFQRNKETGEERMVPSIVYHDLYDALTAGERFDVLLLDPISDIYENNENDRSRVAPFMRLLGQTAAKLHMSVILLGHPAKDDKSTYSGSGAWSSKSRSRWFLELQDKDLVLRHEKSNYSALQGNLFILKHGAVLVPTNNKESKELKDVMMGKAQQAIRSALIYYAKNNRALSASPKARKKDGSGNYFVDLVQERSPALGLSQQTLVAAFEEMVENGELTPKFTFKKDTGVHITIGTRSAATGIWFRDGRRLE